MTQSYDLDQSVSVLRGVGPKKAEALARLGIEQLRDLLYHFPREYRDLRSVLLINDLPDGQKGLVCARVVLILPGRGYGRNKTMRLLVEDATGQMEVVFFRSGFLERAFSVGETWYFYGPVQVKDGRVRMMHPEFTRADGYEPRGIEPVYPLTKGLSQRELRNWIRALMADVGNLEETLPAPLLEEKKICSLAYALRHMHFPSDETAYRLARFRLIYEELLTLQAALFMSRSRFGEGRKGIAFSPSISMQPFLEALPYAPTGAQRRVLGEVSGDMESDRSMNRLVQGDVGSGKTLIAQAAIFKAVSSGYQAAMMAPTELLARQHFETLKRDLGPMGIEIALLTGSVNGKAKAEVLEGLKSGRIFVAVGTHAILSAGVEFEHLGLVITDEQHRFGVNQRLMLTEKGENPDVLVMTATPIPRTLAVVLYGDLDISLIDEMPPGRQPVYTERFGEGDRERAYRLLADELDAGHQAYVVAPLIEDSDVLDSRSAESLHREISGRFPDYKSALLHGQVPPKEKEAVMEQFYAGEIRILVSTVVIEVGIDVPNATVMLIEGAERFGLAQLHQLRGRVGRGRARSYCLIITDVTSGIADERADVFCRTSDGFVIAEKDLELRGPGEVFGFRQHGLPELVLADPLRHARLFQESRDDARRLLERDPSLKSPENRAFGQRVRTLFERMEHVVL